MNLSWSRPTENMCLCYTVSIRDTLIKASNLSSFFLHNLFNSLLKGSPYGSNLD